MALPRTLNILVIICIAGAILSAGLLFAGLRNGLWLLPDFGAVGFIVFLQSFPWFALVMTVALTYAGGMLLRTSGVLRNKSPVRSWAILFFIALAAGFSLCLTPLYGPWRLHNIFRGVVTEIHENGYVISDDDGSMLKVRVGPGTRFPTGNDIAGDDGVLVIGEMRHGIIRAFGIRKLRE